MTKCELLKKLHKLIGGVDIIDQDSLFEAQHIINQELWREQILGHVELKQLSNGFIKRIKILEGKKPKGKMPTPDVFLPKPTVDEGGM